MHSKVGMIFVSFLCRIVRWRLATFAYAALLVIIKLPLALGMNVGLGRKKERAHLKKAGAPIRCFLPPLHSAHIYKSLPTWPLRHGVMQPDRAGPAIHKVPPPLPSWAASDTENNFRRPFPGVNKLASRSNKRNKKVLQKKNKKKMVVVPTKKTLWVMKRSKNYMLAKYPTLFANVQPRRDLD